MYQLLLHPPPHGRSRAGARASWAHVIDAVMEEQRGKLLAALKEAAEETAQEGDTAAAWDEQALPQAHHLAVGSAPAATAAGLAPIGEGNAGGRREPSLGSWLRRVSLAAANAPDMEAAAAAAIASVAEEAASLQQERQVGEPAGQQQGEAAQSASPAALPQQGSGPSAARLLSRASMLSRGGSSFGSAAGMSLVLFPDTTEGRLAQARRLWVVADRLACRQPEVAIPTTAASDPSCPTPCPCRPAAGVLLLLHVSVGGARGAAGGAA
jgi:hypothetical protein